MSMKRIKFKKSKINLYAGIVMLILAVCTVCSLISEFIGDGISGVIIVIVLSTLIGGALFFGGIVSISVHFFSQKAMKEALERYGEEYLIYHIGRDTIHTYAKKRSSRCVYFTDRFVIDPKAIVLAYDAISLLHYVSVRTRYGRATSIEIWLRDGNRYSLCDGIMSEEFEKIKRLCEQMNPEILTEKTKETKEIHKKRVEEFKKNEIG